MSADKSGMHRNTAREYLATGALPSEKKKPHTWRTRKDPFEEVWPEVIKLLEAEKELQALTIFHYLQARDPGQFSDGQLRTLQRKIKEYRLQHGPEKEVFFPQDRVPGELIQIDWMHGDSLGITIAGEAFEHKLFHAVLPYSNWEWATIAASESFLSLKTGLQEALFRLGGVPQAVLSDNSSAATHRIEKGKVKRDFNDDYKGLLDHLKVEGRTINLGCPNENGDVESMHGHLRRRLLQALLMRGCRDFASREEYEAFLGTHLLRANANRTIKAAEEIRALRELPIQRLPGYKDIAQRVGTGSTIRANKKTYSVPARLIGQKVVVRLYENHLEVLVGRTVVHDAVRFERGGEPIDYRHVIGSLVKKPGAFRNYRYREALFPSQLFREVYEVLGGQANGDSRRQDKEYLRLLKLAADVGEQKVADILGSMLAENQEINLQAVREKAGEVNSPPPIKALIPDVKVYMGFLTTGGVRDEHTQ